MQGTSTIDIFFELIQCGIGTREQLSCAVSELQWKELFELSGKQTIIGITFAGIERLPAVQRPPKEILLKWFHLTEIIKKKNIELNRKCTLVSDKFRKEGFRNCILKGQGLAQLYPAPYLRTPGDIDIWLEGDSRKILEYVRHYIPESKPVYHHVDFPIAKDTEIEVHFTPSWMYNPFGNRRLQKFFKKYSEQVYNNPTATKEGEFPVPTALFNRIYILLHIYRHLFQEGIGLRQLMDYYFVLKQEISDEEQKEFLKMLDCLNLRKFTSAMMHIMATVFGMDEKSLVLPPDRKEGEFLLDEVMKAGNFGRYDNRYKMVSKEKELEHFGNSLQRTRRLVSHYPSEALWSPYFKIWHFFWRKSRGG